MREPLQQGAIRSGRALDEETLAEIEQAEAEIERGEVIPLAEAFEQIRRRHLGK
jgi:predicted transcriptional regulator